MQTKELVKPKEQIAKPKTRYFATEYTTVDFCKTLLHTNDQGNTPCKKWLESTILDLNNEEIVTWIGEPIELSKAEFDRKMALPDDFRTQLN